MLTPLPDVLHGLGIDVELDEGDLVASAVVLLKVVEADGRVTIAVCSDDALGWIEQVGMVEAARQIIQQTGYASTDDDPT